MEIQVRFRDYPVREQATSVVETVPTRKGDDIVRHLQKWGSVLAKHITVALEDKINTLLTRDPNKEKVYKDGYDGHCLRAYSYFGDQMPDIVDTLQSINSIKDKYPDLRSKSKAPTFLLTLILASFTGDSNEKLL